MKIKATATTMFVHGRLDAARGARLELTRAEADELGKLGLVSLEEGPAAAPAPASVDASAEDIDSLVGDTGEKMDAPAHNKMEKQQAKNKGK